MTSVWARRAMASLVAIVGVWGLAGNIAVGLTFDDVALLPASIAFISVGVLLVLRVPDNAVSWIVFVVGTGAATVGLVEALGTAELADVVSGIFIFGLLVPGVGVILPLVFPTGRPLNRRWRWALRAGLFALGVLLAGFVLQAIFEDNATDNVGCEGVGSCMALFGLFALLGCAGLAVTSFVIRWRRARGLEREQLRWLVLPFIALLLSLLAAFVGNDDSIYRLAFLGLGLFLIPTAIGVAVSRYKLYEIDRILSRTVAYILVAGVLALVYAAGAVWLPSQLAGEGTPPLFVAGSTLAVAALFNPVRRRAQTWVDRRFNRARYDSERVMDEFVGTLRARVDEADVVAGWLEVVAETMQPASAGVWVRT